LLGKNKNLSILTSLLFLFLFGCSDLNQFSPEEVISNALEDENDISYYGEMTMTLDGVDEMENEVIKEWRHNEKTRTEINGPDGLVMTVNDGKSITVYEEKESKAYKIEHIQLEELHFDPKEQVDLILKLIRDTHDIETVGEDKIAGRPALHMAATKRKDQKSLMGDLEFWIDKEYWMVLKVKSTSGDVESNMEYTKIKFNPKMDQSTFALDLPEDVEIEDMGNIEEQQVEADINVKDIPEKLKQPAIYIPDGETHHISSVTYTEMEGDLGFKDVTIDYKQKDLPLMTLTIMKSELENEIEEEPDVFDGEKVKIRNEEGLFIDLNELRSLSWSEAGLHYSISFIDPNLTLEEVKVWVDEMEEIK